MLNSSEYKLIYAHYLDKNGYKAEALKLFKEALSEGETGSAVHIANIYDSLSQEAEAAEYLAIDANYGHVGSMLRLAEIYSNAESPRKEKAIYWAEQVLISSNKGSYYSEKASELLIRVKD